MWTLWRTWWVRAALLAVVLAGAGFGAGFWAGGWLGAWIGVATGIVVALGVAVYSFDNRANAVEYERQANAVQDFRQFRESPRQQQHRQSPYDLGESYKPSYERKRGERGKVTVTRQPGLPFGDDDPVRRALTQPGRLLFNPPDRMRLGQTVPVEVRLTRSLKLDAELLEGLKGPGKSKLEPIKTSSRMAVTLTGDGFDVKRRNSDEEQDVDEDEITMWEFGVTAKKPGKQQLFMSVSLRFEVSGQPLVRKNIPVYEVPISVRVTVPALAGAVIRDPKYLVTTLVAIAAVIIAAIFH